MSKSNLKKMERNWQKSSVRRMSFQKMRLYHHEICIGYRELFGTGLKYYLNRVKNGTAWSHVDKREMDRHFDLLRRELTDKKFVAGRLRKISESFKRDYDKSILEIKKFPQNWKKYNNKHLLKFLNKYYKIDNSISANHWILFDEFESTLKENIEKEMNKKGFGAEKILSIISTLSNPTLIMPIDMERSSILKVALLAREKQKKALHSHYKKFTFLPMCDMDYDVYDLRYFEKELAEIKKKYSKSKIADERERILRKYSNRKKENSVVFKQLAIDPKLSGMARFYATFAAYKDRKPFVRDQIGYYVRNLFLEVAARLSLSLTETLFLTDREIAIGLGKGELPRINEIKRRIANSAYFFNDGKVEIMTNKNDLREVDRMLDPKSHAGKISGISASPGKAKGTVVIVFSNADFPKFRNNQILAASATCLDFVPLMKRASAIITDEGGLLSHAAIVSRELSVPCIVGTKNATQILHDGDLVEVDADKGIVKILKRKK